MLSKIRFNFITMFKNYKQVDLLKTSYSYALPQHKGL